MVLCYFQVLSEFASTTLVSAWRFRFVCLFAGSFGCCRFRVRFSVTLTASVSAFPYCRSEPLFLISPRQCDSSDRRQLDLCCHFSDYPCIMGVPCSFSCTPPSCTLTASCHCAPSCRCPSITVASRSDRASSHALGCVRGHCRFACFGRLPLVIELLPYWRGLVKVVYSHLSCAGAYAFEHYLLWILVSVLGLHGDSSTTVAPR